MKKLLIAIVFLAFVSPVIAGPYFSGGGGGGGGGLVVYTVATLPASPIDGSTYVVSDGADASDCTVGAGTTLNICIWDDGGSSYVIAGDGAGSGNSFSTHDAPAGTDPVASGAGTLTWLDTAPIVITGDSGADSMTVSVNTATTTAEGVSEWATDAEAVALTADRVVVASSLDDVLAAPPAIGGTTPAAVAATSFTIGSASINEAELEIIDGSTVTTTELEQLATIGATTLSAAQWAALGGAPDTLTGTELGYVDGVTSSIQTQLGTKEGTLTNEAGLYSALSDVAKFYEPADNNPTWGASDSDDATVIIYGDGAGNGGKIDLYNSDSEDGTDEFWRIEANGESINIGPENALTAFVLNRDGSINKSTAPKITFDDTDGADGYIDLNATDANDAVMTLGVDDGVADDNPYIELDGVREKVEFKKPIDGGITIAFPSTTIDMDTTYPGLCSGEFIQASASAAPFTITLPADGRCNGVASNGKEFYFTMKDATSDALDGVSCDAGDSITCSTIGDAVRIVGGSDALWYALSMGGGGCACD
jgi:hypothetical protein